MEVNHGLAGYLLERPSWRNPLTRGLGERRKVPKWGLCTFSALVNLLFLNNHIEIKVPKPRSMKNEPYKSVFGDLAILC